jgi:hypothetical protein
MTAKRDLKRLVRERQARTGESYVTARRHVLAHAARQLPEAEPDPGERRSAIPVVEMISFTAHAKALGMTCRVAVASTLAQQTDPVRVLERVRELLLATEDDPGTRVLRAAVLRGEMPVIEASARPGWIEAGQRFVSRALAGIGGVSENGNMLAFNVAGTGGSVLVIAHLGFRPVSHPSSSASGPRLVLTTVDALASGPDRLILAMIP